MGSDARQNAGSSEDRGGADLDSWTVFPNLVYPLMIPLERSPADLGLV